MAQSDDSAGKQVCPYQGAQFASDVAVLSDFCVDTVPVGVAVPANVNSMVPRNSATNAYMTLALPKLPSGDCRRPGMTTQAQERFVAIKGR